MKELELYIHIPFCVQKCKYCDFLSAPSTCEERNSYMEALFREIESYKNVLADYQVTSIFVGGGTPTTLTATQLSKLFLKLAEIFSISEDAEITVEMNPGTVNKEKLEALKSSGVNRLSIGLQSVNDEELAMLGRIHKYQDFLETYQIARACGFQNINIDLISAIPHQTVDSWKHTLETILALTPPPEHLSAYSLIIEEGTPFYERYGEGRHEDELPDEESERIMYQDTKRILEEYGYHRYEISNYAKPGYECKHNLGYWERKEYLGLGLGAASLLDHKRFNQTAEMETYLSCYLSEDIKKECVSCDFELEDLKPQVIGQEVVTLTKEDEMEEFMFLGLRKINGVSARKFEEYFGISIDDVYGVVLDKFIREKLLTFDDGRYRLTERGLDVSNYVMSEFLF